MLIKSLIDSNKSGNMQYAKFLDGRSPLFSQFGQDIYVSDIVQNCIDVIATECSKLQPRHIRRDDSDLMINLPGDSINRLFKYAPNELMTTKEFIEKVIWLLYLNYNAFIYPTYDIMIDSRGNQSKSFTGFYPLNPTQVDFLQDQGSRLFVRFYFANGNNYTLPYSDIIHLRKKYSVNDIMGGGMNGQPDNTALLKVLQINDTVLQGIGKAIKTSLNVRGILKMSTLMDDDKQAAERARFEKAINNGETGVLPIDLKGEYTPLTVDPKIIENNILEFLDNKVLRWFGVSLPILCGDYSDDQYQAFYNKTLEPLVINLGQAFSKTIFTQREQDVGNEIVFYQQRLELMDVKNKLAIMDGIGNRGALTNNELLALFGMPPYPGGNRRFVSLNYIDAELANEYQMLRAGTSKKSGNGGNNDE